MKKEKVKQSPETTQFVGRLYYLDNPEGKDVFTAGDALIALALRSFLQQHRVLEERRIWAELDKQLCRAIPDRVILEVDGLFRVSVFERNGKKFARFWADEKIAPFFYQPEKEIPNDFN